ncbi:MAG: hypothetical protein QW666_03750, partial [Candidatus Woesearchaeota archaeon]
QSKNNAKDETIRSLEEALKERDKELNAKEKEIASFKMASISYNTPTKKETANDTERKINKLLDKPYQNPLTVREYNKIFKLMENIDGWDLKSKG